MALTEFPEIPPFVPDVPQQTLNSKFLRDIQNWAITSQTRAYTAIVDKKGSAGNFTDIQSAINYVNGLGGGKILVMAGTYTLTTDITLYDNIEIEGVDNDSVIFDFNSGAYRFKLIGTSGTHKKNCWLRNIQIINSRKGNLGAVFFQYVDDSGVENCKFSNNKDAVYTDGVALEIDSCTRFKIRDNYFNDDQISIWVSGSTHTEVKGNYINGADTNGIYVATGSSNFLLNNLVTNSASAAMWVEASHRTQIIGNFIDTFTSYGITNGENVASNYLVIANNYIEDGAVNSTAITLGYGSKYCSITGNVLENNDGKGIYLADADRNTITGNVVTDGGVGIQLDNTSDRNVVVGNQLYGNTTNLTNNGTNGDVAHNLIA